MNHKMKMAKEKLSYVYENDNSRVFGVVEYESKLRFSKFKMAHSVWPKFLFLKFYV